MTKKNLNIQIDADKLKALKLYAIANDITITKLLTELIDQTIDDTRLTSHQTQANECITQVDNELKLTDRMQRLFDILKEASTPLTSKVLSKLSAIKQNQITKACRDLQAKLEKCNTNYQIIINKNNPRQITYQIAKNDLP